jgi:hypothetical protein
MGSVIRKLKQLLTVISVVSEKDYVRIPETGIRVTLYSHDWNFISVQLKSIWILFRKNVWEGWHENKRSEHGDDEWWNRMEEENMSCRPHLVG